MMYQVAVEDVDDKLRSKGKTMNFAKVYGQGIKSMAKNLGVTPEEAKALDKKYFDGLPGLDVMMRALKHAALRRGRIRTLYSRPIHVPSKRLYVALNYLCQGAVGEGTKRAMLELWRANVCEGHKILFQVHDDVPQMLPIEIVEDETRYKEAMECIETAMCEPWNNLNIRFDVDISKAMQTWGGRSLTLGT